MELNSQKDSQHYKIEHALKRNLKKRKIFQNKLNKKIKKKKNERFIRPMDQKNGSRKRNDKTFHF